MAAQGRKDRIRGARPTETSHPQFIHSPAPTTPRCEQDEANAPVQPIAQSLDPVLQKGWF